MNNKKIQITKFFSSKDGHKSTSLSSKSTNELVGLIDQQIKILYDMGKLTHYVTEVGDYEKIYTYSCC